MLADALRRHEPWLEWSGKREKPWFEVEPVALHMHERVSTQAILRVLAREDVERDLFADPQHDYAKAVQFYQHDVDWANRMILGDSLQVMASLARREDLAGKVQMIYLDPPYGISFASNFQPQLGQRRRQGHGDRTSPASPRWSRAYRDTWTLGIHSYLAYLRDRLAMAKELLADTGSIFVQISDENLHRVRCLLDEVFVPTNFITILTFTKKGSQTGEFVPPINEYILSYSKERAKALERFRPIYAERKECEPDTFPYCELVTGEVISANQSDSKQSLGKVRFFSSNALFSQKRGPNDPVVSVANRSRRAGTPGRFRLFEFRLLIVQSELCSQIIECGSNDMPMIFQQSNCPMSGQIWLARPIRSTWFKPTLESSSAAC